ncbi:ATP-binding protein [Streptomyces himalayensis]|uniref:Tetratricopeptide repeat protein n=1 Tax=Streptomyces himalayensis subsp. himalayensis TaxID=2756131 RepID=A0A7W0IDG5_9ACTN|nr:XRE family transcriptional regulator [Streptomyces himalayensis]MBA2951785.1 tetratricopeptide repeat protein [Streptomyces himalayensis subsp. himalayensis]
MFGEKPFGVVLRGLRQQGRLTIEELAEASGVSVRAIGDMERGRSRVPQRRTVMALADGLGLADAEREALLAAARAGRPAGAVAIVTGQAPRQLPPDLATFRGRTEALASVDGLTSQVAGQGGHVVVSAIGGMAGVGKTTLAVHWAHQVADRFPDGQLYVNLRGFEDTGRPLDPGEALGGFLRALGVPSSDVPRGTAERSALFRAHTTSRRLIVVLDNARNEEQVRPLLPASAGCLTIITSRSRLSGLAVAEGASLVTLDVWTRQEALAGLAARIGEERCRAEPEAAAELVELCGFLPLAVAIVGAQLSASPEVPLRLGVRELREARPRLDALSADDPQVDVRAVFSWSYRALTPSTARFFRYLALHPGPSMSTEAAASLAGADLAAARRQVRALTSVNLLSRDADGRYVLHDLVRAYGTELVEREGDDRLGAERRLMDYLCHNAFTASRVLDTQPNDDLPGSSGEGVIRVAVDSREEALEWFRREEPTVAAAMRALDDPQLLRYRMNLTRDWVGYYSVMGRWADEIATKRIGLEAALVLDDPTAIARNSQNLARALAAMGRVDEAEEQVALMLELLPRLGSAEQAITERSIGFVRGRQGRHSEALHHARRALAIYRRLGNRGGVARVLKAIGWYLTLLGDHRQAIAMCEEALPILRETGNRRSEAATWDSIGYARQRLGQLEAAIADYQRSLRLYEEAFDAYNQADVLDHIASAHLERGDGAQARASWARAAELLTTIGDPRAEEMRARATEAEARSSC